MNEVNFISLFVLLGITITKLICFNKKKFNLYLFYFRML